MILHLKFSSFAGTDRPALKYLYKHVKAHITSKWYDIGVELFDVEDEAVLNTIRTDHPGDSDKCAAEMLRLWLEKKTDASWNQLTKTLREPNIKLEYLATKIESLLSEGTIVCYVRTYVTHSYLAEVILHKLQTEN